LQRHDHEHIAIRLPGDSCQLLVDVLDVLGKQIRECKGDAAAGRPAST
jgi:hypothetical protein